MKKTLILGCLAAISATYADTEAHRVSFGADTYYIGHKQCYKDAMINHKSSVLARGVRWSYDYIADDSFYMGVSGNVFIGRINQRVIYFNFPFVEGDKDGYTDMTVKQKYAIETKQIEARTGATLRLMSQLTVTPFVGVSLSTGRVKSLSPQVFSIDTRHEHPTSTTNALDYVCGAFSEYSYNDNFSSGIGVKRYGLVRGRVHDQAGSYSYTDTRGVYELSVPLAYRFVCNESERFSVSLEPYARKQFKGGDATRGARLMLACDF
jgi:hypothetical protein